MGFAGANGEIYRLSLSDSPQGILNDYIITFIIITHLYYFLCLQILFEHIKLGC